MTLVSIAFILFLLLAGVWAILSFLTILLLIRYEGLSLATWIGVGLYAIASTAIIVFVGAHLATVGVETLLPFFSTY